MCIEKCKIIGYNWNCESYYKNICYSVCCVYYVINSCCWVFVFIVNGCYGD